MRSGHDILVGFRRRWRLMLWLEITLYALGPAMLMYFAFSNILWTILTLLLVGSIAAIVIKPWKKSLENIASYIDLHLDATEYSTGLLLVPQEKLSGLARIQQNRVTTRLVEKLKTIKPPHHLNRGIVLVSSCVLIGLALHKYNVFGTLRKSQQPKATQETIVFKLTDTTSTIIQPPRLIDQQLIIEYPNYTQIPSLETSTMDIKAVEGSRVSWKIQFDQEIKSVTMESMGNSYPMKLIDGIYTGASTLTSAGFYNFKFTDLQDRSYVSELYAIEVIKDKSPSVEIKGIKQFTSYEYNQSKKVSFTTGITDDFGIEDAYIIATVSKGSGESVKFREEKLNFTNKVSVGSKNMNLSKKIDLDQMNMEPGDELYFYVEALDRKRPKPNVSRSETFFAVIKDTVSDAFAVEGTMGVDLMPDYFRSQRQLIIDTEKLLKDKPKLSTKDYKFKSNELGFDQKVLRLKYAEFMGDESEFGGTAEGDVESPEHEDEDHHEEGHEEEDPLAKYTHKHDSENEHNLVEEEKKEDPLEEYLHNHEDPEESTLFTQSLKSKLRQALNEMWDAELYLRLYTPEKSLPYQYRALKLIQEIKNSARIYVHRIGFDPPPIKEDKRLTGEIDEVSGYRKTETLEQEDAYPSIRVTLARLEQLISEKGSITEEDKLLFGQAGNELAEKAIEDPGRYLETLQQLKWISEDVTIPSEALEKLQKGLFLALPELQPNAVKQQQQASEINELLLKELEIND
ncbi:tryptophan-rich sensory protein [uncultured Aquimarina sp.]|uniref:tryptophan-rich sensory protein n=1 Tax=uncultured Aquimarina sp. TaxID=575652 RepID=UPI002631AE45|nr:tryptophan-rich sensory protein [uncultured Aquimarina sp.]